MTAKRYPENLWLSVSTPAFPSSMPPIDDEKKIARFFAEIHDIDKEVYSAKDAGEIAPMVERYKANPYTYVCVTDTRVRDRNHPNGTVIGYINFFPVTDELKELILSEDTPYEEIDDGIKGSQVTGYTKGRNFIFFLSAAILPKYRDGETIRLLSEAYKEFFRRKEKEGCRFEGFAACAVSEDGKKYLKKLGFVPHHEVKGEQGKTVFILKGDNINGLFIA